jgi:4-amino-4-deoxy-L-arabinose transferase-like glycosyltransferase
LARNSPRGGKRQDRSAKHAGPPQSTGVATTPPTATLQTAPAPTILRPSIATALAVCGLLALHYALAARSLILENPTVDEVLHLPAGVSYWQKGTFRLYHHNPPLVKLVAALPVVWAKPNVQPLYDDANWRSSDADVSHIDFGQKFARFNADRYFELFQLARLLMPLFSVVGGLAVFFWSRRLYGVWGGLSSLALWVFCPNVLGHSRLVTSDLGAAAVGVAATYAFWRYLQQSSWNWAIAAGVGLGLAAITKFSLLILYLVWPFLWSVHLALAVPKSERLRQIGRGALGAIIIVGLSVLVIDAGYFFEGVGIPLGDFEFGSRALTTRVAAKMTRPKSKNPLFDITWQFRVNRFRGTWLGRLPTPLPKHFVTGLDEQKIETEGLPDAYADAWRRERTEPGSIARQRALPEPPTASSRGYSVYLDGQLRQSGWWYYYLLALAYKVPEGTWALVLLSTFVLVRVKRTWAEWSNEITLATVPAVILISMSFFTDINLGLRYVLPIAPFAFIATGKIAPWIAGLSALWRRPMIALAVFCLASTVVATAYIHPHYLAYFNWASGGPDRMPPHLIDSNLDWGQDLMTLREWWQKTIPGQPLGLVYFGQINPSIFRARGEPFEWFLPRALPGTVRPTPTATGALIGPAKELTPGYYAVSATALFGVPWRYYDPASLDQAPEAWLPAWDVRTNVWNQDGYGYFRRFTPIGPAIGHSIYIYYLTDRDVARVAGLFEAR